MALSGGDKILTLIDIFRQTLDQLQAIAARSQTSNDAAEKTAEFLNRLGAVRLQLDGLEARRLGQTDTANIA